MRLSYSREYVRKTTCLYTVIIQCCDPPIPAYYLNTNSEKRARKTFEYLKADEIRAGGGGEFEIILYQHSGSSNVIKYMKVPAGESEYGHAFVYNIAYEGSKVLERFNYMDLAEAEVARLNEVDKDKSWQVTK